MGHHGISIVSLRWKLWKVKFWRLLANLPKCFPSKILRCTVFIAVDKDQFYMLYGPAYANLQCPIGKVGDITVKFLIPSLTTKCGGWLVPRWPVGLTQALYQVSTFVIQPYLVVILCQVVVTFTTGSSLCVRPSVPYWFSR